MVGGDYVFASLKISMELKQSVNIKQTADKGVGWLTSGARGANPSPSSLLQIKMIQRKSPQHRERRLCHLLIQGGGRRQLNLGQVISWSSGDLGHSILTWKQVPMQGDTCPGSASLGVEGRQQHILNQGG